MTNNETGMLAHIDDLTDQLALTKRQLLATLRWLGQSAKAAYDAEQICKPKYKLYWASLRSAQRNVCKTMAYEIRTIT